MKYVKKPEPIKINTDQAFDLEQFVVWIVNNCEEFNKTGSGIRAGIRIEDAFKRDAEKHYVELTPDHWQLLNKTAENPGIPYPGLEAVTANGQRIKISMARECLRFIDAIAEAKDEPPPAPESPADPVA